MSEFTVAIGLQPHLREVVAAHLDQTYSMNYGCLERQEANYFRVPQGDPAVIRSEPEAVFLRELAAAVRQEAGVVSLKVAAMSKAQKYRVSELVRQSLTRAQGGGAREIPVAECLAAMQREWDRVAKVHGGDEDRFLVMMGRG